MRRADDEEPVDPKGTMEEECKPHCVKALLAYQACQERIAGDTTGEAHCTGQYFDYWQCIDHCVAPNLFKQTK